MVGDQPEYDTETKYTYITEKDLIQTEGATLKPIFTPGHACDHLAFYFEEENSLFSGITILMERIFTDRIWPFFSFWGDLILGETSAKFEDLSDYMSSLQKVMNLNASTIYPGHGPMVKDGVARVQQYIDHRSKRNEQILQVLRGTPDKFVDVADIVRSIYQVNTQW